MALCTEDKRKLLNRMSRVEGQLRGLRRMVEADCDCMPVLKQTAAIAGAVRSLGMVVLEDHLRGCVSRAIREQSTKGADTGDGRDGEALITQVVDLFRRFGG